MTITDKTKDEKLQHDISKEAAKISALWSGKIYKQKYLTGEKILPSNQEQMIEKAKFTYYSLRKAFKQQIKHIKDQIEKHMKSTEDNKKQPDNELLLLKEGTIFKNIYKKRLNKMDELSTKIDYNNLKYTVSSSCKIINLVE